MVAVLFCVIAIVLFFIAIPKGNNKVHPEIDLRASWEIETRERIKNLERLLESSALTGDKVILDLDGLPEHWADLICLNALLSEANCEIIHKGEKLPTFKQVIERVENEPRPSP